MSLKNLSVLKVTIVMAISLVLLFGGWYLHENYQVAKPIKDSLSKIQGVTVQHIDMNKDKISLEVSLNQVEDFQSTYNHIEQVVQPYLKDRSLEIDIANKADKEITKAWNEQYFYIAEAIDQHKYSSIPVSVDLLKIKLQLDKASYSMDENNIYISLHKGNSSLFFVISKDKGEMEVKNLG